MSLAFLARLDAQQKRIDELGRIVAELQEKLKAMQRPTLTVPKK